jgi:hypothetical protein
MAEATDPQYAMLNLDDIEPDPMNPNEQDLATFNELVEGMKVDGVLEPILVTPIGEGRYRIVGGEHRWKGAKLAGKTQIPAIIKSDWDADTARMMMVRMNMLRGKLNPEKFTQLWTSLKSRYGEQELKKRMGMGAREPELKRLLKRVGAGLPLQMKADLERRAAKVTTVEDLAAVVQSLFTKYGNTVDRHFVMFSFGGQVHLMVQADKQTFAPFAELADICAEKNLELDAVMAALVLCNCERCNSIREGVYPKNEEN